jgi:hypothetical protein
MKTQVIMKRELFGNQIGQQSKTGYFSATDLIQAGNHWRALNNLPLFEAQSWLKQKGTKEFIRELEEREGEKVWKPGRGRGNHSYCHPLLFIDMALSISPSLKIEVYEWLFDNLLKFRNDSGDSFKKMSGAVYTKITNKSKFQDYIKKVCNQIALKCGVGSDDRWQEANQEQLKLRDKIQENIYVLSSLMTDVDEIVRISIEKAEELTSK